MDSQSSNPKQRGIIDPRWKIYLQPFSVQLPHAPPEDRTFRIPGTDISMEIEIAHPTYEEGYDFTLPSRTFVFDSDDDETEEIANNKNKTSQLRNVSDYKSSPPNSGNGDAPGNSILPLLTPYGCEPAQKPTTVTGGGSLPAFPTEQVPYYPGAGVSNIHSTAMIVYSSDQQHFPNYSTGASIPALSTWQHGYSRTQHSGWPIANFAPVVYGASPRGNSTTNTKCTRFQLTMGDNYGNMQMPLSTGYNYGHMPMSTGFNYVNVPISKAIPVPLNATTATFTGQYQQSGESFNFLQQQCIYASATPWPRPAPACNFCLKSGETDEVRYSHHTKDPTTGLVICPVLRRVTCPRCKATGDNAHTRRHCPTITKPSKS